MKTNLFDKNGIEIQLGDKYKAHNLDGLYTVYYKSGAVCAGKSFDTCEPLGWYAALNEDEDECEICIEESLDWLELITTNEA